jgi:hypothetical protein
MRLTERLRFVRKEHRAELADHGVERGVFERHLSGVGGKPLDVRGGRLGLGAAWTCVTECDAGPRHNAFAIDRRCGAVEDSPSTSCAATKTKRVPAAAQFHPSVGFCQRSPNRREEEARLSAAAVVSSNEDGALHNNVSFAALE